MVVISREGSNPGEFIAQNEVLRAHAENIHIVTEWITNDGESAAVSRYKVYWGNGLC
jgi:hypothetical protein